MRDHDESARLTELRRLVILDTPPEAIFDSLTELAKLTFGAQVALVSLVDDERQWFKSCIGLDVAETERSVAFCDHAIRQSRTLVVLDATRDPRFRDNPLVRGAPGIRFYAGAPLIAPTGHRLGTLCVIDFAPRGAFGPDACAQLEAMSASVVHAMVMRRDISDYLAIERDRAANEELLTQAEDMAGVGRWSWDPATDETRWSPAVYRIHGCDPALPPPDLAGVLALYHPDDAATLSQMVSKALATGEPYSLQARILRPDGETRFVTARGACERSAEGHVTALLGTVLDVTDLRLADEELRRNEARLSFLTENAADLIIRVEPGKGITWASPSCRAYGFEPADLIGRYAVDLMHPDDRPLMEAARAARFAGSPEPPGYTGECRIRRKDGGWTWVQGNPTVIRDATGEAVEIITILRDVDRQRRIETDLRVARDAAEAASEAKSDFVANMSHEIRTPLTAILGFTRLLAQTAALEGVASRHLARISGAGSALLTIVNDVLDFSKLESGQLSIAPRPTPLEDLLSDALYMFTPQAGEKGVTLALEADGPLPSTVLLDPERVRQVLLNLIGNAVKFTVEGHVRLVAGYDAASGELTVAVEDTGPGLTAEQRHRLFKRFSQVDATAKRHHGGTGLGLAISKSLVEAMGGDIRVTSRPGRGSRFYFRIPAEQVSEVAAEAASRSTVGRVLEDVRVLVIDDTATNLELARAFLSQAGADVLVADSGPAGLELAATQPVDVILLDLRMPGMSGVDALARLRSSQGPNNGTPVLAFTADLDLSHLGPHHGFDGMVHKPMVSARLIESVSGALPWSTGASPATASSSP